MNRLTRLCEDTKDGKFAKYVVGSYTGIYSNIDLGAAVDKLGYYEDLEEQGKLIEAPCKVNDIIWVVGSKCLSNLYKRECDSFIETNLCPCHLDDEYIVFPRVVKEHLLMDLIFKTNANFIIGKNVFLTKEEAEKALEKRNDGN